MLTTLINSFLSPAVLVGLAARVLTVLLRHRLYIFSRVTSVEVQTTTLPPLSAAGAGQYRLRHIFVIQNMEPNDLLVPFQLQLSTTSPAAHIHRVELQCGLDAPFWQQFELQGVERHVLTAQGMGALETWKILCETNDQAEGIRLVVQGWDMRRDHRRWWAPTLSQGGLRLNSCLGRSTRAYAREPEGVVWVFIAMLVGLYVAGVRALEHVTVPSNWVWPFRDIAEYIYGLGTPWVPWLDWSILGLLLLVGEVVRRVAVRGLWREVALGYLGDPYWRGRLELERAIANARRERAKN